MYAHVPCLFDPLSANPCQGCIGARSNDQKLSIFSSFFLDLVSQTKLFSTTMHLSKHDGNSNGNGGGGGHDASTAGHGSSRTGIALDREGAVIPIDQGNTVAEGYLLVGASLIANQALSAFCIIG